MVILSSSGPVWIRHILACMGSGCFGCYSRPAPIISVDEPSKGLRIQGQPVHKRTLSEDFWWSSSTIDLDNSMLQSLRSNSSISTSGLNLASGLGSLINEPEFVNHGLNLWNESRLQWIGSSKPTIQSKQKRGRALSWNATYDSVITRKTPFARPVPLTEMVEFLVEAWDQDGVYDY